MINNKELVKRFVKDFKLPITIFEDPYFNYFIELYDSLLDTKYKLSLFLDAVNFAEDKGGFFDYGMMLSKQITEEITNTNAYNKLIKVDMNKEYPLKGEFKIRNIYTEDNEYKEFISIDLNKANFNILGLLGIKEELSINSYEELVKRYTELDYYVKSKLFRQVIFGNINPNRQQRLQKYVINQISILFEKEGYNLFSASSDELIIENKNGINAVLSLLKSLPKNFDFYRVERFNIQKVDKSNDFFVKKSYNENNEESIEFKNVPAYLFPQVYKKYFGLELNEKDMTFIHDGLLAEYKEPLFKNKQNFTMKYK